MSVKSHQLFLNAYNTDRRAHSYIQKHSNHSLLITFSKNDDLPEIIDIARQLRIDGLINHEMRLRHILLDSAVLPKGSPLQPALTPTHSTLSSLVQELQLDY
jgi:hypothetical protein